MKTIGGVASAYAGTPIQTSCVASASRCKVQSTVTLRPRECSKKRYIICNYSSVFTLPHATVAYFSSSSRNSGEGQRYSLSVDLHSVVVDRMSPSSMSHNHLVPLCSALHQYVELEPVTAHIVLKLSIGYS